MLDLDSVCRTEASSKLKFVPSQIAIDLAHLCHRNEHHRRARMARPCCPTANVLSNPVDWETNEWQFASNGIAVQSQIFLRPDGLANLRNYFRFDFASRKSFTIGTIIVMRLIRVTCVVSGKIASLDSDRGPMSP